MGRIYDRLCQHFGEAFMDVDDIPPGANFRQVLDEAVGRADILLAVIGTEWAELIRQRKSDPRDFVRIEIQSALKRGIPVVPLLIGNTAMPSIADLPDSLFELQDLNAYKVDPGRDFNAHVSRLVGDLEKHYGRTKEPALIKADPFANSLGMPFVLVPGLDGVLFSIWQTRVQDYAAFAKENPKLDMTWKDYEYKGHKQGPDHPVVNVSHEDATAFCQWLSHKEGRTYRLPTDHEWSVAVGIGGREDPWQTPKEKDGKLANVFPWGSAWPPLQGSGNFSGSESASPYKIESYNDPFPFTAPVGSFKLEHNGIKDLSGNVWEWCEDKYDVSSAAFVVRGGAWGNFNFSLDTNAEPATQMLEFTRGMESKMRVVNLHELLMKTARESTVGNNVKPELSIQAELWDVEIDLVQLRQVFQNIMINGCQAMPNGGPMHISARNATVTQGNTFGLPVGNFVLVGIRDRGCGIPPESVGKVFDPYFTTKIDGTGIGMALCKQIVERHRGKIMVESVVNVGTEFIIFLPVATVSRVLDGLLSSIRDCRGSAYRSNYYGFRCALANAG